MKLASSKLYIKSISSMRCLAAAAVAGVAAFSANATERTWQPQGGSTDISDPNNWGGTLPGNGDRKKFGNGGQSGDYTVTIKGVGYYTGTVQKAYRIDPQPLDADPATPTDPANPTDPATPTDPEQPSYTLGDVDGDNEVTSGDARLTLRASVQLEKYEAGSVQFLAADVEGNGAIESSDARTILRVSVKLETFA